MLDIKFIREHPEEVEKNLKFRGSKISLSEVLILDNKHRELLLQVESLRAERNQVPAGKPSPEQLESLKTKKDQLNKLEEEMTPVGKELLDKLSRLPNMSSPDMPEGKGDPDHIELAVWLPESGYLEKDKLGKGANAVQYMPKKII